MDKVKSFFGKVKEFFGKLSTKIKALIIGGAVLLIVLTIVIAVILSNRPYAVLFSGLNSEEARQIATTLTDKGISYKMEGDSTILVEEGLVNQTKATLVQEGYPKSGFTYDTFKDNAGLMTTDSDKQTYKLYELQDRIGSTIRLFDGVKDAKVTIALGEQSKYALNDDEREKSSATAVVTMFNGGSPTEEQAAAIQRLVAKSVPRMELEDVAVFDGNGLDVSVESARMTTGSDAEEIAAVIETQISNNVMKVLSPIYGKDNVRVSARAKINMEQLIRETTVYNTPEKIDENDKTGIISHEELYNEGAGGPGAAGGVAGAETNADTAEYNTNGNANGTGGYSESVNRDYLVNQIKEQGQITPGALDDLTLSVAINGTGYGSLRENQLRALIGNAAGVAAADQAEKITVVSAPFDGIPEEEVPEKAGFLAGIPLWVIILAIVLIIALIAVIVILVLKKKKQEDQEEEEGEGEGEEMSEEEAAAAALGINHELQEIQNDRAMELKQNLRDFAEENSEMFAQLLKNWLTGGDGDGNRDGS